MSGENILISQAQELPAGYPPFDFTFLFPSSATRNELKAHKDTLSSKCEFFRAMFNSGMADALVDHMSVDDFSPATMSHFLHYLCHGTLHKSFCFMELFKAGSFFGCPDLCLCLLDGVADAGALCAAAESIFLVAWPEENIPCHFVAFVTQNLGSLTSEELTGLSEGALGILILVASHGMCWAVTIFQLLESWAIVNGLQVLPSSLVELVPFERMWATEFEKHVETSSLIPTSVLLSCVKTKARDWSLLSGTPTPTFTPFCFGAYHGIAVAPQQFPSQHSFVVYVSNYQLDTIHMFDGTTGQTIESCFGQFGSPRGMAVASRSLNRSGAGGVFVCDYDNHRVQVFSAMGVQKRSFGRQGTGPGQLSYPDGVSIDHVRHKVHVCDRGNNRISVFAESDGIHLFSYGSYGSGRGQLVWPTGVAVDSERGFVAVVDAGNPRVSVFKTSGEFVRCFGHGDSNEDGSDPKGQFKIGFFHKSIALDPQSGHIVVSDDGSKRVQVMTWEGEWVGGFGPGLPVRGPELKEVNGVAVGHEGQLFLCCQDSEGRYKVLCF